MASAPEPAAELTGAVSPDAVRPERSTATAATESQGEDSTGAAAANQTLEPETAPQAPAPHARRRGRGARRSTTSNRRRDHTTMASDMTSAQADEPVQTGRLSFDTTPWTNVSLGGRSLGQTPLLGIEVPAGTHVLRLSNPELGVSRTYSVTVRPGEATRLRIALE